MYTKCLSILLSDGSGLTSRQVATQAATAGHFVEALSPTRLGLASFTRHVRRVHRVPAFGAKPWEWLEATLELLRLGRHDLLLPTQEQVALLSREASQVRELGVGLAVPPFASLLRVQDKVEQATTLRELGLPHPPTWIAHSREQLLSLVSAPVFLKAPIGTASNAVKYARDEEELIHAAGELDLTHGLVVQDPVPGPLAMIQAVFDDGSLVAWHANLREREGSSGGASVKQSISAPAVGDHLRLLGGGLRWHGAISLDAILTPGGPCYIDINPRLVEPGNAWRAGVDLVGALLAVSRGEGVKPQAVGRPGIRTHQLLVSVLGIAQHTGSRRAIVGEIASAIASRGTYAGSSEELTPVAGDPVAAVPVAAATLATLAHPPSWRMFAGGAVSAYALTPAAWSRILEGSTPPGAPVRGRGQGKIDRSRRLGQQARRAGEPTREDEGTASA